MKPSAPPSCATLVAALETVLAASAGRVVVAVSGGVDSIALMHLLAAAAPDRAALVVGTVDHRLRDGSAADAAFVAAEAVALGVEAHVLPWEGPKPVAAVQERARTARYALLLDLCRQVGAGHLVTAHTQDDQAETVLMRLGRGSGVAGLAAMAPRRPRGDVVHLRPLLGIPKAWLAATATEQGWAYREDPSNGNLRFARARLRRLGPLLAAEGVDAARLSQVAARMARAEAALRHGAEALLHTALMPAPAGTLRLDGRRLAAAPEELVLRVLATAVDRVAGAGELRLDRLETLQDAVRSALREGRRLRRTFGGALIAVDTAATLTVAPEPARRRGRVHAAAKEPPRSAG